MLLSEKEKDYLCQKYSITSQSGNNQFLDRAMKRLRSEICLLDTSQIFTSITYGKLTQLWIQTPPCRFSESGKCTICNYWKGNAIPNVMDYVCGKCQIPKTSRTLLINTCGSCLDEKELPLKEQIRMLEMAEGSSVENVILETHWSTLTEKKLTLIRKVLHSKTVFVEIGVESIDRDVLKYCLNKPSSDIDMKPLMERLHSYGYKCIVNVVLGIPFLSAREQMEDTVTIHGFPGDRLTQHK